MNRAIKFRFYSKILKRFAVPEDSIFVGALKDSEMEVMQFTGLLDKNGREIYEGDLLWDGGYSERTGLKTVAEVKQSTEALRNSESGVGSVAIIGFRVVPHGDCRIWMFDDLKEWEVIGNVWENRELLGELE